MMPKLRNSGAGFKSLRGRQKVCSIERIASASVEYEFKIKHPQEKIIAPMEKTMRGVTLEEEENIKAVHRINSELIRETIRARKREICRTLQPKLYQDTKKEAIVEIMIPRFRLEITSRNKEETEPSQEVEEIIAEAQTRFEDNGDSRRGGRNRAHLAVGAEIEEGRRLVVWGG